MKLDRWDPEAKPVKELALESCNHDLCMNSVCKLYQPSCIRASIFLQRSIDLVSVLYLVNADGNETMMLKIEERKSQGADC